MATSIRRLHKNDYDNGIIELLGQLTTISKDHVTRRKFEDYVDALSGNDNHFTIVVEGGNKIIGTATLLVEPKLIHNVSKVGHIEDVVVDQKYRGHGIGTMMIEHLTNKVILDCDEKNAVFYEKCGFKKKGVEMAVYFE
jgi:glucosamine-phosphate N-acetyltransferase